MKFNFKKIASGIASGLMIGSTIALAAAASYPAPFVQSGRANAAIVVGADGVAATSDTAAAAALSADLNTAFVSQGGSSGSTTATTITGESYPLFTTSSPLLLNSTLHSVRQTLTATQLPTILADGTFEGTTNVDYTQRIDLGGTPLLEYKAQPTSDDDPQVGYSLGTSVGSQYIYNASVTFDSDINFTLSDSVGETLKLFGKEYTVGGATTASKLVLLRSSQTIDLGSTTKTSASVTVDGKAYTVELTSASDTDARVKVTDSSGVSDTKTINEDSSKTINNVEIGVTYADEKGDGSFQASLIIGSSRVTLQDGSAVKIGTEEDTIDGTQVEFYKAAGTAGSPTNGIGKIVFKATAMDSDHDALLAGQAFVDPIFGSFMIQINDAGITGSDRENIEVKNSGSDKMTVNFLSHDGTEAKTVYWAYNRSDAQNGAWEDLADNNGKRIATNEMQLLNKSEYLVLSNTDEGGLYQITAIHNDSSATASDDYVRLKNVFTGKETEWKATTEGSITGVSEQGKSYTITYSGAASSSDDTKQIRVNYDESSSNNILVYPTVSSSKGAKVMFYEPTNITLANWDGLSGNVTGILFENGDGYSTTTVARNKPDNLGEWNITFSGGSSYRLNTSVTANQNSTSGTVGVLTYNITASGTAGTATIYLVNPKTGINIKAPALVIMEEKDESNNYQANIVTLDGGYDGSDAGIGVNNVVRTWGTDAVNDEQQLDSNNDKYTEMDIWGTVINLDKSDSDQVTAVLSYPDNQFTANAYVAESTSTTSGGSTGPLGDLVVKDSLVSSVSSKNLIVLGGSCVNTAARRLIDGTATSPICGAAFTAKTGIGAGSYLIQSFDSPWSSGKVALLVAGYNADDTTNAATALRTKTPALDVTIGKKWTGTTATSVTPALG